MVLKGSKYAPRTPAENHAISKADRVKQEKEKAARLFERLRWKAESLASSYMRAMEILHVETNQNAYPDQSRYAFVMGTSSKQAESMFKVDFFEFYTLLERYIMHCFSILGVSISAIGPRTNVNALRFITNPEFARRRPEASHQFHANLIEALDDEKNPLHTALGIQDVRIQLGLAKDYRNRWKDADEKATNSQWLPSEEDKKQVKLEELELEKMLRLLLYGCEQALNVVHERPASPNGALTSRDFDPNGYDHGYDTMETDNVPLEYMDDAMDLD